MSDATAPRFLGDGYPPVPVLAADADPAPESAGFVPLEVPEPVKDGEKGADSSGLPAASTSKKG
jgi:hypothetical protein